MNPLIDLLSCKSVPLLMNYFLLERVLEGFHVTCTGVHVEVGRKHIKRVPHANNHVVNLSVRWVEREVREVVLLKENSSIVDALTFKSIEEKRLRWTFIPGRSASNVFHVLSHHRATWPWERGTKDSHLLLSLATKESGVSSEELTLLFFVAWEILRSEEVEQLI